VLILPVTVLAIANLLMHLESFSIPLPAGLGIRLGIAAVLVLVSAIGGRIIPAFTRNWLAKRGQEGPEPHSVVDRLALGVLHTGLLVWTFLPDSPVTGALLVAGALLNFWRLLRWRGASTREEPLLLVLHVGYAWFVIGLVLLGLSVLGLAVPLTSALHALTVGAMGTMILAVMTRATRGHTGRTLTADSSTILIFVLIFMATLARVLAGFAVWTNTLLLTAALGWILAFSIFIFGYGRMLVSARQ